MTEPTVRLTMAQAIVRFLCAQYTERDGRRQPFFAGCFGIFGHGNVSGMGQALQQFPELRYYQTRNEQAMVHTAIGFAKHTRRLRTLACTTSIGPGATNMVTGAATATINRLPVLLLPGDIFARRNVAPVLQQLESEHSQDISVNDAFRPVSRYWDRINRPDQLVHSLPEAMRVLTSPADTGAVTIAIPQDVQTEAYDYPAALFEEWVWYVARPRADLASLQRAADLLRQARRPLIVAGGGVRYSEAEDALRSLAHRTGVPVAETMAGKGSLNFDDARCLGAMGATGTAAANVYAREADVVMGVGTRWSDFTTASKTAFQDPGVRFINLNVSEFDAGKHQGVAVTGDARACLEELEAMLPDKITDADTDARIASLKDEWESEVDRIYALHASDDGVAAQGAVIGAVNEQGDPEAVMVGAAGSLPGDTHKLWRSRHSRQYHLEYGYSCMGYEIAGAMGVKMADPNREVYVLVGDGSYLMMSSEIVTSVQEGYKLTIVLMDNSGFKSIGGLSRSLGQSGFGTRYLFPENGALPTDEPGGQKRPLPVDLAANAASLGAVVIGCKTVEDVVEALARSKEIERTVVIHITNDRYLGVDNYETWWDVPVAEISEIDTVNAAREEWEQMRSKERFYR